MLRIFVSPAEVGWLVDSSLLTAALIYRSGGQAERAAKRLAQACAACGFSAEVLVRLASGEVVGRLQYAPARPDPLSSS